MSGKVYLVGAGPGDPGLLTCKGKELLMNCQVVVYDRLASDALLELVSLDCKKIDVGKRVGNHPFLQSEINEILVEEAKNGNFVVRLKGGDPFVFGRGGEEIKRLQEEDISYEVIPGITSAIAVPEWAGIPVTHRGVSQSFHVITGHTADGAEGMSEDISQLAKLNGTLIFLMGVGNLEKIVDELLKGGMSETTPVAIIERGTLVDQRITRGKIASIVQLAQQRNVESPAIILVGNVANLDFSCEKITPKKKYKVGIIGTDHMFSKMAESLIDKGGQAISIIRTQIVSRKNANWDSFCQKVGSMEPLNQEGRDWVLFTSANGVEEFFRRMFEQNIDRRKLGNFMFAVLGEGTGKKLEEYGYYADFMPQKSSGESCGEGLAEIMSDEDIVYIPRATKGSQELVSLLSKKAKEVVDMTIYELELEYDPNQLKQLIHGCDYVSFFNGMAVDEFMSKIDGGENLLEDVAVVALGNKTASVLNKWKIKEQIISECCRVEDLCNKIREDYDGRWNV